MMQRHMLRMQQPIWQQQQQPMWLNDRENENQVRCIRVEWW